MEHTGNQPPIVQTLTYALSYPMKNSGHLVRYVATRPQEPGMPFFI